MFAVLLLEIQKIKNMFGEDDSLGKTVRINAIPFKIIGVFEAKGLDSDGVDQDDILLVPINSMLRRILNQTYISTIYAKADSRKNIKHNSLKNKTL